MALPRGRRKNDDARRLATAPLAALIVTAGMVTIAVIMLATLAVKAGADPHHVQAQLVHAAGDAEAPVGWGAVVVAVIGLVSLIVKTFPILGALMRHGGEQTTRMDTMGKAIVSLREEGRQDREEARDDRRMVRAMDEHRGRQIDALVTENRAMREVLRQLADALTHGLDDVGPAAPAVEPAPPDPPPAAAADATGPLDALDVRYPLRDPYDDYH